MINFKEVFKTKNPVIGVVHFMPLLGYPNFAGLEKTLEKALRDLQALEKGGVDGILVENNYDIPHRISVLPETIVCMTFLTAEIRKKTRLPMGVVVLWNDFRAALSIAKVCRGDFVRVPVFVDNVRTSYGEVLGSPEEVISYRKKIGAENVQLLTDIHVKHATLLNKDSLEESARKAIKKGSDALIITGNWTGEAPVLDDLERARKTVGKFPILVGSGVTKENIGRLTEFANGVIVSTSLKTGKREKGNVNIKGESARVDEKKVRVFMKKFAKVAKRSVL